ncbi:MAG: agmatine deiminase family protein, partial [Bryobacterales bacterium]|nr:agmatine deiminase family protein [Bryobacterales bacterium]
EYEYDLKLEFGADDAVNLSGLAAHIDYFVSILPDSQTLMVSREHRGDLALCQSAIGLLISRFGSNPLFLQLKEQFATEAGAFGAGKPRALELLDEARKAFPSWDPLVKVDVFQRLSVYWNQHCHDDDDQCTSSEGFERMLETDPALAKDWVSEATLLKSAPRFAAAMVGLLSSQIENSPVARERLVESKLRELRKRGYDIVEVPEIPGDPGEQVRWAGINYVNSAIIDNYIFVPEFALGVAEDRILEKLQQDLPAPFVVVPVYARNTLALNGGVHCVVGFRRSPEQSRPTGIESRRPDKPGSGERIEMDPALISK